MNTSRRVWVSVFGLWVGFASSGCSTTWGGGGTVVNSTEDGAYTVDYLSRDGKAFLVLAAGDCRGSSLSGGPPASGRIHSADGREIAWACAASGKVTIDGQNFELANGALFLVTTKDRKAQIDQVAVDVTQLQGENTPGKLRDLAKSELRVEAFLRSCQTGR